jgi:hypothetical protein
MYSNDREHLERPVAGTGDDRGFGRPAVKGRRSPRIRYDDSGTGRSQVKG